MASKRPHLQLTHAALALLIGTLPGVELLAAPATFGAGAALSDDDNRRPAQSVTRTPRPNQGARPAPARPHSAIRPSHGRSNEAVGPVQQPAPENRHNGSRNNNRHSENRNNNEQSEGRNNNRHSEGRNNRPHQQPSPSTRHNEQHNHRPTQRHTHTPTTTFGPGEPLRPQHHTPSVRIPARQHTPATRFGPGEALRPQHHSPPPHSRPARHTRHTHFYPGRRFHSLPHSHRRIWVERHPYYYNDGIFYRFLDGLYVVVRAPLGAVIASLPSGAVRLTIGGNIYYTDYKSYFRWDDHHAGYVVVEPPVDDGYYAPAPSHAVPNGSSNYYIGEVVDTLPSGSHSVTIDTIQYFQYGDTYFRPMVLNGRLRYVVSVPN